MCGTAKGTAKNLGARIKISHMVQKGNRSKRRRPRKGFPHRVVGYLDDRTHEMVSRAAERIGENISSFVARAVKDRAESILDTENRK
jgi:uncharacterized protein DUF1778